MKKNLHLSAGRFSRQAEYLIEAEKKVAPDKTIETGIMTRENAEKILAAIFSADSICFWNGGK
jgi:hypothetical protein